MKDSSKMVWLKDMEVAFGGMEIITKENGKTAKKKEMGNMSMQTDHFMKAISKMGNMKDMVLCMIKREKYYNKETGSKEYFKIDK